MSRQIKFNLEGVVLEAPINKIDRAKLYGTSTREVFDENGEKCTLSDLYLGSVILPKGSISQILIDRKAFPFVKPEQQIKNSSKYIYRVYQALNKDKIYSKKLDQKTI